MALQVAFVACSVDADVAFERRLARVHAHVARQKALPVEDLWALGASKRQRTSAVPAVNQVAVCVYGEPVSELLAATFSRFEKVSVLPVDVSGHVATPVGAVLAAWVFALDFASVDVVLIGRLVVRVIVRPKNSRKKGKEKRPSIKAAICEKHGFQNSN